MRQAAVSVYHNLTFKVAYDTAQAMELHGGQEHPGIGVENTDRAAVVHNVVQGRRAPTYQKGKINAV